MHQSAAILAGWPWGHMQASLGIWWVFRGGSRIFLGGGALVSCSTSTPINQIVFFCRIPVVLENHRSSWGGGCTPCTLPLDLPLVLLTIFSPGWGLHYLKGSLGKDPRDFYHWLNRQQFEIELVLLCKDQEPPLSPLPTSGGVLISA